MSPAVEFFLRAKHWQIFVLTWGVYGAGQIILSAVAPSGSLSWRNWAFLWTFEVIILLFVVGYIGWFWSMGHFLDATVKASLRLNVTLFRVAVVYVTAYLLVALPLFLLLDDNPNVEALVISLHLFAVFCFLYLPYFVSKNLAMRNKGKPVTFEGYSLYLFLLVVSFLGVWTIQPRINQLYAETKRA
jgi:hypothetical protein